MATNLAIDDRLLDEAQKIGGHRTKKATVTRRCEEYIQRRKQPKIVDLFERSNSIRSTTTRSSAAGREGPRRHADLVAGTSTQASAGERINPRWSSRR